VEGYSTSVRQHCDRGSHSNVTYTEGNFPNRTPNNYVTIAGGDGCNTGRIGNQGLFNNTEEYDTEQDVGRVYAARRSEQEGDVFLTLGEHTLAYDASGNAVVGQSLRHNASRAVTSTPMPPFDSTARTDLWHDDGGWDTRLTGLTYGETEGGIGEEQDHPQEPIRTCNDPSWASLFNRGPSTYQLDPARHPTYGSHRMAPSEEPEFQHQERVKVTRDKLRAGCNS
jgi:hypothetical protein